MLAIIRKTRYAQLWSYELDEIVGGTDLEPFTRPEGSMMLSIFLLSVPTYVYVVFPPHGSIIVSSLG